jgi:hypothetical protein
MEIIAGAVAVVILFLVLNRAFSSENTKLFRRIWAAERSSSYGAQTEALNRLYEIFNINITFDKNDMDMRLIKNNIGNLLLKSIEFDIKYKNNLGVLVSKVILKLLELKLHSYNIHDLDASLEKSQDFDISAIQRLAKQLQGAGVREVEKPTEPNDESTKLGFPDAKQARELAIVAYEEGFEHAENLGHPKSTCHQVAVVNVLKKLYTLGQTSIHSDELIQHIQLEVTPFNAIEISDGREGIIEYFVWLTFPDDANVERLMEILRIAAEKISADERGSAVFSSLCENYDFQWSKLVQ